MKYNKQTSCNSFKWGREGVEGERWWVRSDGGGER
jgi:hypothetical protein